MAKGCRQQRRHAELWVKSRNAKARQRATAVASVARYTGLNELARAPVAWRCGLRYGLHARATYDGLDEPIRRKAAEIKKKYRCNNMITNTLPYLKGQAVGHYSELKTDN